MSRLGRKDGLSWFVSALSNGFHVTKIAGSYPVTWDRPSRRTGTDEQSPCDVLNAGAPIDRTKGAASFGGRLELSSAGLWLLSLRSARRRREAGLTEIDRQDAASRDYFRCQTDE